MKNENQLLLQKIKPKKMKRNVCFFAGLFMLISLSGFSQLFSDGFESWTNNKPDNWAGLKTNASAAQYAEYNTSVHGGSKALQLIYTGNSNPSHVRFTTQPLTVVAQTSYTITFWVRGKGEIRTGLFDGRPGASSGYADYNSYIIVDDTNWTQKTQNIIAATDTSVAEFILSFRSTNASKDHLQVDDVVIASGTASIDSVSIYDIQFTSNANGNSPYSEQFVFTSGVVTGKHAAGYFIQDGSGPWTGIYVYDSGNVVALGDSVSLTGKVKEYYNFTELTSVTGFTKHASGLALPQPAYISVAQVKTEPYESVLVKVGNVNCAKTNAGYGMWQVNQGTDSCKVDTFLYKFTPTLNAKYDITAIVNYSFSEFRLSPRSAADVQPATSVQDISSDNKVQIFPNPSSDYVTITSTAAMQQIRVYSLNGQMVYSNNNNQNTHTIQTSQLSRGTYYIHLTTSEGVIIKPFVKD